MGWGEEGEGGEGGGVTMVTTGMWWSLLFGEGSEDEYLGAEPGDGVETLLQEGADGGTGTSRLMSY